MIRIREADEEDNEALIQLQRRCPQGTDFVLGVDCSPDYYARSRPFKDWHVLVAVDGNSIVGSAACAVSDTHIEGRQFKTAYEYGFIVDPHHRRKGIAIKLQEHIDRIALDKQIELLHLDITEDNLPSINLFSKMGFNKVKDCLTFSLIAHSRQKIARQTNIRSMEKSDVDGVAGLMNEMYHDYDFFTPFQAEDFIEYVRRMPHFDLHNILIHEDNEDIQACLGYWNYNKVRRYIVQRFNWRTKAQILMMKLLGPFTKMPSLPKQGEPLSSYNLTTLAYKNPESITELIKYIVNVALENGINFLHIPVDPESPIPAVLSKFRHTKLRLHFFTKSLKQERVPNLGKRKLYIDISEL